MTRTPMVVATSLVMLTALLAAQKENPSLTKNDNSVYAELAKATRKARTRRNPLEHDPEAVAAGAKLFGLHCAGCHGEMAEGSRRAPGLLADPMQQATPGTLFWILTKRRGPSRHARVVQATRTTALADRDLSEIAHSLRKVPPVSLG
jgi:mono/diheme cytochrome c family protein